MPANIIASAANSFSEEQGEHLKGDTIWRSIIVASIGAIGDGTNKGIHSAGASGVEGFRHGDSSTQATMGDKHAGWPSNAIGEGSSWKPS
jgi:hypothetical protein